MKCEKCLNRTTLKKIEIDISILTHNDLTWIQKITYGVINELTNKKGYCFATNDYLSKLLDVSSATLREAIQKLDELDLIVRKIWTVNRKSRRYIYVTNFNRQTTTSTTKIKKEIQKLSDDELSFFDDMWKGYTLDYVKTKKGKDGNFRGGGSKSDAKEKFRAILKAGIPTSTIEEFVSGFMNLDMPKDLSTLLKLGDVKMLNDDIKKSGELVKLRDIVNGVTKSVSEEDAKALEGKRWMRI